MRFVGISNEDLNDLHRSMELFEQLYGDREFFNPYLFVIVNQGPLLVLAKDAIQEGGVYEEGQEADQPSAIAVAIPLGSDALHYLTGSGLYVGDAKEEFAYAAGNGEGVRTGNFTYAGGRERLHLNQIIALAIAEDDTYLDEFLQSHGPKEAVKTETPEEPVERTESVTKSSLKSAAPKVTVKAMAKISNEDYYDFPNLVQRLGVKTEGNFVEFKEGYEAGDHVTLGPSFWARIASVTGSTVLAMFGHDNYNYEIFVDAVGTNEKLKSGKEYIWNDDDEEDAVFVFIGTKEEFLRECHEFVSDQAPETPNITESMIEMDDDDILRVHQMRHQKDSSAKRSGQKGIDKVLISGKPISNLKVTEVIEVSDFVVDHKRGSYIHAEVNGNDWLFYSNDPAEGKAAVERMLMLKLDLDDKPEVSVLSSEEISDLLEGLVDEQE